jgi:hypothetical protein
MDMFLPTAIGPMMPARKTLAETYSASHRKVKKDTRIRMSTTKLALVEIDVSGREGREDGALTLGLMILQKRRSVGM